MYKNALRIVNVVIAVVSFVGTSSQSLAKDSADPSRVQNAMDRTTPIAAARASLVAQGDSVLELVRIVRQSADPEEVDNAIRLLGQSRSLVGIKVLVDHISFRSQGRKAVSRLSRFPAAQALVDIGTVVYPDIYARLARDTTAEELYILAFVAFGLDGREMAMFRFERAARDPNLSDAQKAIIKKIKDLVSETDFDDIRTWPH